MSRVDVGPSFDGLTRDMLFPTQRDKVSPHKDTDFPHRQTVRFYANLSKCCTITAPGEKRMRH